MTNIALKLICSIAGLFGVFILAFTWFAFHQGYFASLDSGATALKIGGTVIRAVFLLLCAWAAWRQPYQAAWFAWGACFAFVVGGAVDVVFKYGLFSGFGNLIPTYYYTSIIHALLAITAWLFARESTVVAVGD